MFSLLHLAASPVRSPFASVVALALAVFALPVAAQIAGPSGVPDTASPRFATDRLIVRFEEPALAVSADAAMRWENASLERLSAASGVIGARALVEPLGERAAQTGTARVASTLRAALDRTFVLELPDGADVEALARVWSAQPGVVYAEPDFVGVGAGSFAPLPRPTLPFVGAPVEDEFFYRQWGFENTGSNAEIPIPLKAGADINARRAWTVTNGSSDIVVAVLDSGLKLDHPDIASRIWTNAAETADGTDNDGNGLVDDLTGWDYANADADPTDDHGHGTIVAGLIGAIRDNGVGYAGIDPSASLMILKVVGSDLRGFYSWWIAGIMYAVDHGADVINLSVGGTDVSQALQDAVDYAHERGVLVTASMMNTNTNVPYYPAAYPNSVAVGATDGEDQRAVPFCDQPGSNYGPHIDLVAPGNYIIGLSTLEDGRYPATWGFCGTSGAAPLVAGAASMLLAIDPTLEPEALRAILRETAADQVGRSSEDTPGFDVYHGSGRLDVFAAVSSIANPTSSGDAVPLSTLALSVAPNPTRGTATVSVDLSAAAQVRVEVFDALGRRVALPHDGPMAAVTHPLSLDTSGWPPGIYLVRAITEAGTTTRTLTVAR